MMAGALGTQPPAFPGLGPIRIAERGAGALPMLAARLTVIVANAVVLFLLSHYLEPVIFGRFVAMVGASLFAARLIVFGCDFSTLRLFAHAGRSEQLRELAGAAASVLVGGSLAMIFATAATAAVVEAYTDNWPVWLIAATCISGIGTAFVDYTYAFRLARSQYARAAMLHAGTAVLRLLAVSAVAPLGAGKRSVFWVYAAATLASGLIQLIVTVLPNCSLPGSSAVKAMLGYSAWQAISMAVGAFSAYQGVYLLTVRHAPDEAGTAGLAVGVCAGVYALYQGLAENVTIRALKLSEPSKLLPFLRRTSVHCGIFALVCCAGVLAVYACGRVFFHSRIWDDGNAFLMYGFSAVVVLLHAPAEAIAHYAMKPSWIVVNKVIRTLFIAVIGALSLPTALSAAEAQLSGTLLAFIPFVFLVIYAARQHADVRFV